MPLPTITLRDRVEKVANAALRCKQIAREHAAAFAREPKVSANALLQLCQRLAAQRTILASALDAQTVLALARQETEDADYGQRLVELVAAIDSANGWVMANFPSGERGVLAHARWRPGGHGEVDIQALTKQKLAPLVPLLAAIDAAVAEPA